MYMKKIDKYIIVATQKIEYIADVFYDISKPDCKVIGGDWDISNLVRIEDSLIFKSLSDMFLKQKEWHETDLYYFIKKGIDSNDFKWNCDTIEALDKRGEYLKGLYKSIKENGLLTHKESVERNLISNPGQIDGDDVSVAIGRKGNILFIQNGSHRLCISKILGIDKIPVKVYRRHSEWEISRNHVFEKCERFWKGKTYQQLPHPDFDEIENIWSDGRYDLLRSNTSSEKGDTLLDIGSLFGYICYRAELDGYDCTACEIDDNYLSVMRMLHEGYDMDYKILTKSFLEMESVEYDVIIAFNILHHFLKRSYEFSMLERFLEKCRFREMFLQVHENGEAQMIGAYKDFSPEEFSDFVMKKTNKDNCVLIGEEMNRKIYKIF